MTPSQKTVPFINCKFKTKLLYRVITIIVLLILAGVSISMLTGENVILTQAQRAKNETEKAQLEEENILSDYEDFINGATGAVSGGEWNEEKGVNTPALKGDMELVRYENGEWVEDETGSNYSYVAGSGTADNNSSEWANARVTVEGVNSYFVWIPRYAYKITYKNKENISEGGIIDVKFLKGTSNIAADGTVCKYADDEKLNPDTDYIIHPAFTSNVDLGGWRNELTGIWIGKYESARLDATSESEGESIKIKVQPGVVSFRNTTIGDMYTYARAYSENLNSHMLKNSEWGVIVYLTYSQYGRNGTEITKNGNTSFLTADGGFDTNPLQSTTGNIYGIYDLNGGAAEYVAAYCGTSSSLSQGKSFANTENRSNEYSTVYDGIEVTTNYIFGDATNETNNWYGEYNVFIDSHSPFFGRGGHCNAQKAGIFNFGKGWGNEDEKNTFRMCLVI